MNQAITPEPGDLPWAEVEACTLPTAQRPLRLSEFDGLFATTLRGIEVDIDGSRARLLLVGEAGLVDRVQCLADAESACCSFFSFTVTQLDDADGRGGSLVAFDIEVPTAYADVLAGLVALAEVAGGVAP